MDTQYKVLFSEISKNNLADIINYISNTLQSPRAAGNVLNRLQDEIQSLSYFPNRYPLADETLFPDLAVRKLTVQNYSVYYHVDEIETNVLILSVIYARRDQKTAISEYYN